MVKKRFVKNTVGLALASGFVFLITLYRLDPRGGVFSVVIFMLSLFILIVSSFSLIIFLVINKVKNNESSHSTRISSLRRGALVGGYAVIALSLSALELLTWWDAILLSFSLILFELYFMSGKERIS